VQWPQCLQVSQAEREQLPLQGEAPLFLSGEVAQTGNQLELGISAIWIPQNKRPASEGRLEDQQETRADDSSPGRSKGYWQTSQTKEAWGIHGITYQG